MLRWCLCWWGWEGTPRADLFEVRHGLAVAGEVLQPERARARGPVLARVVVQAREQVRGSAVGRPVD